MFRDALSDGEAARLCCPSAAEVLPSVRCRCCPLTPSLAVPDGPEGDQEPGDAAEDRPIVNVAAVSDGWSGMVAVF